MQPKPPPKPKRRRKTNWAIQAILSAILLAGGFAAYRWFFAPPPPPPPVVRKSQPPAPAPKVKPAAPTVPLPGQGMIDAGQNAVTARRAKEQERVDALLTGQDVSNQGTGATPPPPPASKVTTATATTTIAPGITATSATLQVEGTASPAFRSFVANSKISGVFQGTPVRAFINGTLYRAGDVVSLTLGIRFAGIDADAKTITFRDDTGATVTRKY